MRLASVRADSKKYSNKFTKQRENSLMKLEHKKDESLKRIRSISKEINFNNKLQKVSFKISSRNQTSLMSSKSPRLRKKSSKKQIIASTKMVSRNPKKGKELGKLNSNYHSSGSGIKVNSNLSECIKYRKNDIRVTQFFLRRESRVMDPVLRRRLEFPVLISRQRGTRKPLQR